VLYRYVVKFSRHTIRTVRVTAV